MIEVTDELRAAKSGSYTERSLDARFDRIEAIVAANAGPEPEPQREVKSERARPSSTKQEEVAI